MTDGKLDPKAAAAADLNQLTAQPVAEANLAEEVEEFEEKNNDFQAVYNAGGSFRAELEKIASGFSKEREPILTKEHTVEELEEIPTNPELGKEVEGYMEKVEKETELAGGVTDDYAQRVLYGSDPTQKPNVVLPLTEEEMKLGLHQKVWKSVRWLAVWCLRQIKLLGGRAKLKTT